MSDLKQVFLKVHQLYTGTSRDLHSTRMKEKLIIKSPGLPAHRRGKQVVLTTGEVTREAVLAALSYSDDDGKDLVQAAKRICQDLSNKEHEFKFSFDKNSQKKFRPNELNNVITNDIRGTNVSLLHDDKTRDIAVGLSQVVKFNAILKRLL